VKLTIPSVFAVDEKTARKNRIQRLAGRSRGIDGNLATFTRDRLKGLLFESSDGMESILIVPPKSKNLPETYATILSAEVDARNEEVDVSNGIWLRNDSH